MVAQTPLNLARLLVACWRISGPDARIPSSHGILDRALHGLKEAGQLPQWAREALSFVDSRVGLQCVELAEALDAAQEAELTAAPNPSYSYTEVKVSPALARRLARQLGLDGAEATAFGQALRESVAAAKAELEEFEAATLQTPE